MDLSLVHKFLHPSQIMRTLAETGSLRASDSEARTQMREQKIAEELGKTPGKDFPDIFESGPYGVRLDPAETQPRSAPQGNAALPVNPMKYEDLKPLSPAQPTSLPQIDSIPVRRLSRLNSSASLTLPVLSSDNRSSWSDRFESAASSLDGIPGAIRICLRHRRIPMDRSGESAASRCDFLSRRSLIPKPPRARLVVQIDPRRWTI
jgi:hypothetical protein